MIKRILTYYASRLDEYLSRTRRQPEGLATVGAIGNAAEERPNKMVVSLLNVERETTGGISAPVQHIGDGGYVRRQPPLPLNLNVILAAVYDERRYAESLSALSDTLRFIQSMPKFEVDGTGYTIEIASLSTQDMNNVWTLLGGQYYPSVICKVRGVTLLDSLREAWERHCRQYGLGRVGIRISSGYRCPELNRVVGGSSTSAHRYGYAFDLVPSNGKMRAFKRFCRAFLAGRAFDQLISEGEDDSGMPKWMHVGYKHPDGEQQRGQYLSMIHGKYYPMTN